MKRIGLILAMALCMALPSLAARYRVSEAGIIDYTNSAAKILSGQIVDLTYRYGIAAGDIASNKTGSVFLDGVWLLARADTNAIALGANVYQNSISNVTGTAGVGKYIGQCVEAVTVCTELTNSLGQVIKFVKVDIGAPQRQIVVGTDIQAHSANLDKMARNDLGSGTNLPITITKQTGAVTASGTITPAVVTNVAKSTLNFGTSLVTTVNSLVVTGAVIGAINNPTNINLTTKNAMTNGTIGMIPQTTDIVTYNTPVNQYGIFTNVYQDVTNTYSAVTNVTWTIVTNAVVTNAIAALTPQTVAVVDGATLQTTPVTPTFTPQTGSAVASATLQTTSGLADVTVQTVTSGAVVVVVTGGGAVVTNITASNP